MEDSFPHRFTVSETSTPLPIPLISMAEHIDIFKHARTAPLIDDPNGTIARLIDDGSFEQACTLPAGSPATIAALESNGRMPVDGLRSGMAASQVVVSAVGLGFIALGVVLIVFAQGTGASVAGVIIGLIGALLCGVMVISVRKRVSTVAELSKAWDNGWLRFAPARVGGVWISGVTCHGNQREDRDTEYRFRYRALVEVYPTDGTAPFRFHSSEFTALADRHGRPMGLKMVEGPLDHFEPEFSNGWTIARWIAGDSDSATITTDLSLAQIKAALAASNPKAGY